MHFHYNAISPSDYFSHLDLINNIYTILKCSRKYSINYAIRHSDFFTFSTSILKTKQYTNQNRFVSFKCAMAKR